MTVNLRMPGQYYDAESGLFYNWNRYYNPAIGRYISSDPIGLEGGLNTFLYAAASPVMYADPEGLMLAQCEAGFGCNPQVGGGGGAAVAASTAAAASAAKPALNDYCGLSGSRMSTIGAIMCIGSEPTPKPMSGEVCPLTDSSILNNKAANDNIPTLFPPRIYGDKDDPSYTDNEDDDDEAYCKAVKDACIAMCSDGVLPTKDYGASFTRCVRECMEKKGCSY